MTPKNQGLPWSIRFAYGFPALALAVIGIPIYVYLPKFYTDTIGIPIAAVGGILLGVRLFDAVTDPIIGHLSDTVTTAWGRRRPFIGLGAVGLCIALLFLFIPPGSPGEEQLFRFGFWLFTLFFFWTLVTIPYESLGPELTTDYHERTTLFSLRDGCLIVGTVAAAASPKLASWLLHSFGLPVTERGRFILMALVYAPLILAACSFCVWRISEHPPVQHRGSQPFFSGYGSVLKNRPFLILLAAYTISAFGSNLPATLILYYVQYVLEVSNAETYLLLYFVTGILFLPLWVALSRKTGKKSAWIIAMVINTGAFAGVYGLGPGDSFFYGILVVVSGIGFGAGLALPSSIQADVIDYDEMITGRRREGRYIGLWSIAKKMAAALGVGVGLWLLGAAGYTPNSAQGPEVITMLRVLYALVPCLCNAIAIIITCFFPITEKRHQAIREAILKLDREGSH